MQRLSCRPILPLLTAVLVACVPGDAVRVPAPVGGAGSAGNPQPAAPVESAGPAGTVIDAGAAGTGSCGLTGSFRHVTRNEGTKTILTGGGALAYKSDYAVNTDGAPNSYHPDDPYGREGLAINTICNGADAIAADGRTFDYSQCRALVDTFRQARAGGWTAPGGARMRFYAMVTTDARQAVPCLQADGAFVSTTTLIADPSRGQCDQARYLNANTTNFIIRPGRRAFAEAGMEIGDLAVVFDPASGRSLFAVVGDVGPSTGLGEGSVAIGKTLGNRPGLPRTRAETYGFAMRDIVTVVLPGGPMGAPYSQARIDAAGARALEAFGGIERVKGCAAAVE